MNIATATNVTIIVTFVAIFTRISANDFRIAVTQTVPATVIIAVIGRCV